LWHSNQQKKPNEWFDDGRGDSPRLRFDYSTPRPSTETLIFGVHPIWKPETGLPCLQLGLVLVFLEGFTAGSKAYLYAFRAAADDDVCGNLALLEPVQSSSHLLAGDSRLLFSLHQLIV
jgi:hypothetical protein